MKDLKIGLEKERITPDQGIELAGYGYFLQRRNTGALMDLWIRSLALEINGCRLVILVSDLVGVVQPIVDQAVEEIAGRCQIAKDAVIAVTTHTHTGPAVSNLCGCGEPDPEYYAGFAAKMVCAAERAFANLVPVTGVRVNQMEFADSFARNRVVEGGEIDDTVRTVYFERKGARPAALINYSCHPVSYAAASAASPDYPGILCNLLEKAGVDGIYLNGFCGNINPKERGEASCAEKAAQKIFALLEGMLANGTHAEIQDFALSGGRVPIALRRMTMQDIEEYFERLTDEERASASGRATAIWAYTQKKKLLSENPYQDWMEYKALRLGSILIVFHSGEVCVEFGKMLQAAFPEYLVLFVGTSFSTTRYIATKKLIEDSDAHDCTGYEAFTSAIAYNCMPIACGAGEEHFQQVIDQIRAELH